MKSKYIAILLFCLLVCVYSYGQEQLSFDIVKEFYLEGDARVIGNSIMGKDVTEAYNDIGHVNDEFEMEYVDIDTNPDTFSSSSALLELPEGYTIVYAGLYWSGTYGFEKSVKRPKGDKIVFKGKGKREGNIQTIKFKMPNGSYQDIDGTILYDGLLSTSHQSNAPYVCYREVTDLLTTTNNLNGVYTVANVNATQGYISGGSCAGWMLYLVYEAPDANPKYITTHHGFEYVNKNRLEIEFKNFKAVTEGQVNTSITLSSLEGDSRLYKDQFAIWNQEKRSYIPLENELRAKHNFFTSAISRNGVINTNRTPASINTLGFDIAQMKINNPDNVLIANETQALKFRYTTKADRYYLFFTAFETEIDNAYYNDRNRVSVTPDTINTTPTEPKTPVNPVVVTEEALSAEEIRIDEPASITNTPPIEEEAVAGIQETDYDEKQLQQIVDKKTSYLEGITPGYYLVTNVFSEPERAIQWENFLNGKGHNPNILVNPENNWSYVYIDYSPEAIGVARQLKEASQKDYLEDLWVFKINID